MSFVNKKATLLNVKKYVQDRSSPFYKIASILVFAPGYGTITNGFSIAKGFSSCRGFLADFLYTRKKNLVDDYYYGEKEYTWKTGNTVLVAEISKNFIKDLIKNIPFLHGKESRAGTKLTKIYKTNFENIYIFVGDKKWKDSVWKFMLWSFYIKSMCFNVPESCDRGYWETIKKKNKEGITKEEILLDSVCLPPSHEDIDTGYTTPHVHWESHERTGFVSICSGTNKIMNKKLGLDF